MFHDKNAVSTKNIPINEDHYGNEMVSKGDLRRIKI